MLTQDKIDQLIAVTKGLTAMYAEDEDIIRTIVEAKLSKIFKRVILADNGADALQKYRQGGIDIILTDNLMPIMNGLEFITEVRKDDIKVPIILITAHMDTSFLIQAINLGVTQFVAKPISYDNLLHAIEIAVQRVVIENLAQKSREQELELLRYREKYHSLQQEMAFKKELNIIRNDLFMRKIDITSNNCKEWFVDLYYAPLDIMSGDSYSIREISANKYLFFLVDAMGKGLSASVTTILSTSFVNHLIDKYIKKTTFLFKDLVSEYLEFIKKELLNDEIVCASFTLIDFFEESITVASFSMPPLLMLKNNDELMFIKANNMPIMKYMTDFQLDTHNISDVTKMLIYSDGLNESIDIKTNLMYQQFVKDDFAVAYNKKELGELFSNKIGNAPDDDVTFIFLKRADYISSQIQDFEIPSKQDAISDLTMQIEEILIRHAMPFNSLVTLINSLTEMLVNAFEHGNLEIDSDIKNKLLAEGTYEQFITETEKRLDKKIKVTLIFNEYKNNKYTVLKIKDEGKGFDTHMLLDNKVDVKKYNGRGIKIAQKFADEIYYNKVGNEVILIKKF